MPLENHDDDDDDDDSNVTILTFLILLLLLLLLLLPPSQALHGLFQGEAWVQQLCASSDRKGEVARAFAMLFTAIKSMDREVAITPKGMKKMVRGRRGPRSGSSSSSSSSSSSGGR